MSGEEQKKKIEIRIYRERWDSYNQNSIFQKNQRSVYRKWKRSGDSVVNCEIRNPDATADFWPSIWSVLLDHTEGVCFNIVAKKCENITPMTAIKIEIIA